MFGVQGSKSLSRLASTLKLGSAAAGITTRRAMATSEAKPPFPPFDEESAKKKVQMAEDAWNTRDPVKVSMAYTEDSNWRNRDEFFVGREKIREFLTRKWQRELDYKLKKTLFCYKDNRIAVTFQYEYRNAEGQWFRAYGNENWDFAPSGLMERRQASINDVPIAESERVL